MKHIIILVLIGFCMGIGPITLAQRAPARLEPQPPNPQTFTKEQHHWSLSAAQASAGQLAEDRPQASSASSPLYSGTSGESTLRPSVPMLPIAEEAIRWSYPLEAAYDKTTHIIFPSKVIYVDLGSGGIVVDKVEPTENVLRVKANQLGFTQTTLVVITEEGKYYPFLVDFNENPRVLHLNMAGNVQQEQRMASRTGLLRSGAWEGITMQKNTMNSEQMKDLASQVMHRKRFVKDVGVMSMKMSFTLTGVFIHQKTLLLQIQLENRSEIDYSIDFFKFFIKDRDVTKRMAYQEVELPDVQMFPVTTETVPHKGERTLVFVLPMVTYGEDKVLEVQVYEQQGGRHLRFELDSDVIIRAKGL